MKEKIIEVKVTLPTVDSAIQLGYFINLLQLSFGVTMLWTIEYEGEKYTRVIVTIASKVPATADDAARELLAQMSNTNNTCNYKEKGV